MKLTLGGTPRKLSAQLVVSTPSFMARSKRPSVSLWLARSKRFSVLSWLSGVVPPLRRVSPSSIGLLTLCLVGE